jgi:hypothetical protein
LTHAHYVSDYEDRCYFAAWGNTLERQREIDLPLMRPADCEQKLKPVFEKKERGHTCTFFSFISVRH